MGWKYPIFIDDINPSALLVQCIDEWETSHSSSIHYNEFESTFGVETTENDYTDFVNERLASLAWVLTEFLLHAQRSLLYI